MISGVSSTVDETYKESLGKLVQIIFDYFGDFEMEFRFDDVNVAFQDLTAFVEANRNDPGIIVANDSRNGPVLKFVEPVTITFTCPWRRVLFNSKRDANPFFHLYEAMWMLAGRNDVKSLEHFASKIGQYSDDGRTFHGAYGYRWRSWFGEDQLLVIAGELTKNPTSRRCVLQMWDGMNESYPEASSRPRDYPMDSDLSVAIGGGKDVPCNTECMFQIREVTGTANFDGSPARPQKYLDMTVINRSNDLVWGLLGANVVHFSYLLEYMANAIGVEMGNQIHFTNNLHIYTENNSGFKPKEWTSVPYNGLWYDYSKTRPMVNAGLTSLRGVTSTPERLSHQLPYMSSFLSETIDPAIIAFNYHKARDYPLALDIANDISSPDWRKACTEWLQRRFNSWRRNNEE